MRVANVISARMQGIRSRAAARRQVGELRGLAVNRIVVAVAEERHVGRCGIPVHPAVKGVVLVVLRLRVQVIAQITI